jgi:hypothetical protein
VRRRNARARWSRCGERKLAGGAEEPTGGESGARARPGRAGVVVVLAVAIEEMKMGPRTWAKPTLNLTAPRIPDTSGICGTCPTCFQKSFS